MMFPFKVGPERWKTNRTCSNEGEVKCSIIMWTMIEELCAGDISAGRMIFGVEGVDSERREKLISLLDIDVNWKMHTVSDGQRRRVQICIALLKPFNVSCPHENRLISPLKTWHNQ